MGQNKENYELLNEDQESFRALDRDDKWIPKLSIRRITIILTASIIVLSSALNIALLTRGPDTQCSSEEIMAITNFHSSTTKHIDPVLVITKFDGSFMPSSVYSQAPGPEVDAVWEELSDGHGSRVTEEELKRYNMSTDHVSIPDDEGGYAANFEYVHQLHCLNMIRMSIFPNYDYYHTKNPDLVNGGWLFTRHLRHCIEMLRQVLVCNADIGIVPFIWLENVTNPVPDFFTWHVCKNFDSVLEYNEKRRFAPSEMWKPKEGEIMQTVDTYFGLED